MRYRQLVAVALIVGGVSGCTSSAPADSRSPSTPSGSVLVTRSPTDAITGPNLRPGEKPPMLDALGSLDSPAGALTFAAYWLKALDWAYGTNESTLTRQTFSASCTECERFASIIDRARSMGAHFVGGRLHVEQASLVNVSHHFGSTRVIDLIFAQDPSKEVSKAGAVLARSGGSARTTYREWLRFTSKGWTVVDLKRVVPK